MSVVEKEEAPQSSNPSLQTKIQSLRQEDLFLAKVGLKPRGQLIYGLELSDDSGLSFWNEVQWNRSGGFGRGDGYIDIHYRHCLVQCGWKSQLGVQWKALVSVTTHASFLASSLQIFASSWSGDPDELGNPAKW